VSGQDPNSRGGPHRVLLAANESSTNAECAQALEAIGCQVYLSSPTRIEELEQLIDLLGPAVLIMFDPLDAGRLDAYRRVKTPPHRALLPVIMAADGQSERLELTQAGVEAVLAPPVDTAGLQAAVAGILERIGVLRQHKETDDLTGALTETALQERLDYEVSRARRYRRQGCLVLIDLDNYDRVRQAVGELAADAGLRRFSQIVRHELRETDMLGRLDGDRFCIVMPDTDLTGAVQAIRRVLAVIGSASVDVPGGQKVTLAASAGLGSFGADAPEAILTRVGGAISRAKAAGGGALFTA
jgi:diguanylate cyclase (GGDEF)-like protein